MISVDRFGWSQLGNQLFQWAMLRAVSIRRGFEIRLPMTPDLPKCQGKNELTQFRVHYGHLNDDDRPKLHRKYTERSSAYDPNVFEQPDWTLFDGYFQSERYFADIAAQVRQEVRFVPTIEAAADHYIARLRKEYPRHNVVALHVRRGDYLAKWALGRFRVLPPAYFHAGAEYLPPGDRVYLVFSDDMPWCRRKLRRRGWNIEYCETESHWHDLAVLSRCDHFIISPSSFSWWGAWLATNPRKVVVTPRPWFGPMITLDPRDIVPQEWIQLAC